MIDHCPGPQLCNLFIIFIALFFIQFLKLFLSIFYNLSLVMILGAIFKLSGLPLFLYYNVIIPIFIVSGNSSCSNMLYKSAKVGIKCSRNAV